MNQESNPKQDTAPANTPSPEQRMTFRWVIIKLTGLIFAAYAAYNVYLIVKEHSDMSSEGIFLSVVVAVLFAVLVIFSWTSEITDIRFILFRMIRRISFIIAMLLIFALRLRIAHSVIDYIDTYELQTILNAAAFFSTQAALLLLIICYTFFRRRLLYQKTVLLLTVFALALLLISFFLEAVLYYHYGIGLEATQLRTRVIRPIFYSGFIGLAVYFLFPPKAA